MAEHLIAMTGHSPNLQRWFDWMNGDHSPAGLSVQLADNVVFKSPVVHTPQEGKPITMAYLTAAGQTLGGDTFRYTRVFDCGDKAGFLEANIAFALARDDLREQVVSLLGKYG